MIGLLLETPLLLVWQGCPGLSFPRLGLSFPLPGLPYHLATNCWGCATRPPPPILASCTSLARPMVTIATPPPL